MPETPALGAVIFDLDGLLLDTEQMARRAFRHALEILEHPVEDDFFLSLIGRTGADSERMLQDRFGARFRMDEYKRHTRACFDRELNENGIPVKPGAHETIDWLQRQRIPFAIATSSLTDRARYKLEVAGLHTHFQLIIGGDQVERGKPAPDIVLRAANAVGVEPTRCVVFEDSYNGLRSAHAAGAAAVMVPDLLEPDEAMSQLVRAVIRSLADAPALLEDWLR
ncbi:MAG: HAD family phosphatase [Gammaproteobacteria bacterium]|nr:HAD family phosphatase [Gammaproteobacteria bacterium]